MIEFRCSKINLQSQILLKIERDNPKKSPWHRLVWSPKIGRTDESDTDVEGLYLASTMEDYVEVWKLSNIIQTDRERKFRSGALEYGALGNDYVKFPESRLKYYKKLKEGQNWRNLPLKLQKEALGNSYYLGGGKTGFLRRLGWNKPSPTLVTDPMMPATDLAHPVENRPLSIQEYKRIQEFPDDWKLAGSIRNQYKQVGNAVPVSLGRAIGKLIVNHILKKKIKIINNFKYSRYLYTSELNWNYSFSKKISNQKEFNF